MKGGGGRWSRDTTTGVGEMLQPITPRIHSTPNTWRSGYVTSHVHFLSCCVIDWLMKKDRSFLHFTNQQYGCRKFRYPLVVTFHLQGSISQNINLRYILFRLQCKPFTLSVLYYRYKLNFMTSHKISTFTPKLHAFLIVEQCFSTVEPRPDTGPRHQIYRAARGSPGIYHFSFLSNCHE